MTPRPAPRIEGRRLYRVRCDRYSATRIRGLHAHEKGPETASGPRCCGM